MRYPFHVDRTNQRRLVFFGLPIVLLALGLAIAIALAPAPERGFDVPAADTALILQFVARLIFHLPV